VKAAAGGQPSSSSAQAPALKPSEGEQTSHGHIKDIAGKS
jgi:hypothetical protein